METGTDCPVTLAFLGCGWATRIHSRTLRAFDEAVVCRYASRDQAKAAAYNRRYDGGGAYVGYETAIADPDVAAVVVATPPSQHLTLTLAALAAGKHVVVEKPAFLDRTGFRAVRRAAAQADRQVLVAENYHYKPLRGLLRTLLAEGVVGRPLFLQINALRAQRIAGWREDPAEAGTGALLEGGIHWIDFLTNLGYPLESVRGYVPSGNGGPDRSMLIVAELGFGPVTTLHYSWEVPSLFRGLRLSRLTGSAGTVTFETNGLFVAVHGPRRRLIIPSLRDIAGYRAMWTDFVRSLRHGVAPAMTLELAEQDLATVEAIYASLR